MHTGCSFESGVSSEVIARAEFYPRLASVLKALPPKLIELHVDTPPIVVAPEPISDGAGPRLERIKDQINRATFTGSGDREMVQRLFQHFVVNINVIALTARV